MNFLQRWLLNLAGVKAISNRPDLANRQHIYTTQGYAEPHAADFNGYATVYGSYAWVRKAIGVLSDNFAALPVRVVDSDESPIDGHMVTALLENVNDEETPVDLWSAYIIFKMLSGEAPIEIVPDARNRPAELWIRRPDWVLVRPDRTRLSYPRAAEYVYQPPDIDPITVAPQWLLHDKFYNPLNPYRGLAPIAAVREGIIIDLYSQMWSKRFMQNSARPDFALVAPQGITTSERERYLSEFMRKHQGQENAHLPVVLEDGVTDIKTFSYPPKDLEWLEQRRFSRDEVGAVFGVPDEIMGYGKDTYENFQTALEVLWTLTLQPMALRRDTAFTNHFQKAGWLRPGERIATDFSGVGVLQEDVAPKIEMAIKLWDRGVPWQVLNERFGLGLADVPGGDVGYVMGTMTPVDLLALNLEMARNPQPPDDETPDSETEPDDADDTPDDAADEQDDDAEREAEMRRLRTWAKKRKRPDPAKFSSDILSDAEKAAIVAEVTEDGAAGDALPFDLAGEITPDTLKASALRLDDDDEDAEQKIRMALERRSERRLREVFNDMLDTLFPEGFGEWENPQIVALQVQRRFQEEQALYDELNRALQDGADLGVSVAVEQFENIAIGFDYTLAHTQARAWAAQYTGELITGITQTTVEGVRQSVTRWVDNGEPLEVLIQDLGVYFNRDRASLIASTEVTRAYARGAEIAYRESGIVQEWEWATAQDEQVCPTCLPLHRVRAPLGQAFTHSDGRQFTAPAHPRCRCWVRPVVPEPEDF